MPELVFDAVHWEDDGTGTGTLVPRATPADLNYPTPATVQQYITYGVDDVYEGTLVAGSNPPDVPTLTVTDQADGSHAIATIADSSANTTNTVLVSEVKLGGVDFSSAGSRTDDGNVTLTLTPGRYWAQVHSEWAGGESYSAVVYFQVTPFATEDETYRVVDVLHVPGDARKTLVLDKIR